MTILLLTHNDPEIRGWYRVTLGDLGYEDVTMVTGLTGAVCRDPEYFDRFDLMIVDSSVRDPLALPTAHSLRMFLDELKLGTPIILVARHNQQDLIASAQDSPKVSGCFVLSDTEVNVEALRAMIERLTNVTQGAS